MNPGLAEIQVAGHALPTGGTLAIAGNTGADSGYTKTIAVTLTTSATGAAQMAFRNGTSGSWSTPQPYASGASWTLAGGDGSKTVEVEYLDAAGYPLVASQTITLDATAPTGNFAVDSGAAYTTSRGVSLTNAVTGAVQMRYSVDGGSTWSSWTSYATSGSSTLTSGDGSKTVDAQFRDAADNVLSLSQSIALDTTAPTGTVSINGGVAYTNSTAATLTVSAADSGSGVAKMRFSNDSTTLSAKPWTNYATSTSWPLTSGNGVKTVYVQFQDAAGNPSAVSSATITLDTTLPIGSFTVNSGAAYTNSAIVKLTNAVTGAVQMRFRDHGGAWTAWETYVAGKSWTVPAGDGVKTIDAQYANVAGSFMDASSSVTLDTTAPRSTATFGAIWHKVATSVGLVATDAGAGPMLIQASIDGIAQPPIVGGSGSVMVLAPSNHRQDGLHTISYAAEDGAGNWESTNSAVVGIDTQKPTPKAGMPARVRRGKTAILKFNVADAKPNGGTAAVTITLRTLRGKQVKQFTIDSCRVNRSLRYQFHCTLKKGTYLFYVSAVDTAGNAQSKVAQNTLTVR